MRGHPFGIIYMRLSFAGRNSELEQLRTLYLQGRHVLIVGPPGIGKTALLNEFRTRAPLLICKDPLRRIASDLVGRFGIVLLGPNHTVVDRLLLLLEQILEDELTPSAAAPSPARHPR